MSVIVKFSDGSDWFRANWFFRQLRADITKLFPTDIELHSVLEIGQAFGLFDIAEQKPEVAERTLHAMKAAARATIQGQLKGVLEQRPNDVEGERMYLESMRELLERIDKT
jgi:hypothetical protein